MAATRIHHLNFVVRDLDEATARFEKLLGVSSFEVIDHAPRSSRIARSRLGDSWLVLVCPYDENSAPGRHLAEHGEGFFLLSVGVDNLTSELERLDSAGVDVVDGKPRDGIKDWRIADIGTAHGALLQMTDDS